MTFWSQRLIPAEDNYLIPYEKPVAVDKFVDIGAIT